MFGKIALGAAALTTAAGGGIAAAQGSTQGEYRPHQGKHHETRQEIRTAIAANDFAAWYDIVSSKEDSPIAAVANEALFAEMVAIHELHESGDHEAAREAKEALREAYNLPERDKQRHGKHKHAHRFDAAVHEEIRAAVADRDYDLWAEILTEQGVDADRINEDHFNKMIDNMESRTNKVLIN